MTDFLSILVKKERPRAGLRTCAAVSAPDRVIVMGDMVETSLVNQISSRSDFSIVADAWESRFPAVPLGGQYSDVDMHWVPLNSVEAMDRIGSSHDAYVGDGRDPVADRLCRELWAVVGADVSRHTPQDEQIAQRVDDAVAVEPAILRFPKHYGGPLHGGGSTAVACARLAHLVSYEDLEPSNTWMISFTRTAVGELTFGLTQGRALWIKKLL